MNGKKAKKIRKLTAETMEKVGRDRGFKFYCRKAKDLYNRGLLIPLFIIVLFMNVSYSETFEIPASCFPKVVQAHFIEYGYKVDLSPNDRDDKSWAFLENEGTKFKIITYYTITDDELILLREISIKLMAKLQEMEK